VAEAAAVLAAARAYLDEHGQTALHDAAVDLAPQFGVPANPGRADLLRAWQQFKAQVGRALDKLAAAGACTKVKAHHAGPAGTYDSTPRYYTDAAWQAAAGRAAEQDAAERELAARCEAANGRLAALGIFTAAAVRPSAARQMPELRDVHQWERLLAMIPGPAPAVEPDPHGPEWM